MTWYFFGFLMDSVKSHAHKILPATFIEHFDKKNMKVKALFLLTNIVAVQGFFGGVTKPKVALNSPEADEAIAFFQKKYPKKEPLTGSDSFSTFGVPKKDIDGSSIQTSTSGSRKRLTDIDEKEGRATFAEMAKVYGAEESLGMIKAMPIVLTFNKDNFAGSLAAWGENFGEEEAKAMVMRNPGLLAIAPKDAAVSF